MMDYDRTDIDSIRRHAARLTNRSLRQLIETGEMEIETGLHSKGVFGQVLEREYFRIPNNSSPEPDFREVGMELKIAPIKTVRGGMVSKERMVLGIINYEDALERGFHTFEKKSSHILIVFYSWDEESMIYDYLILKVVEWEPDENELRVIREDWTVIEGYIRRGEAHLLSERHTLYLSACTKGVGHGCDMVSQPNSPIPAKRRALSFKASFVTHIFNDRADLNETLSERRGSLGTVFDKLWREDMDFEEFVLQHFESFEGMTCGEIERRLGVVLNPGSKSYYRTLTLAMLGILNKKGVKEFEQADIVMKTVRLKTNGTPKEAMSFPAFDYEELAREDEWVESTFFEQIDHRFLFVVYRFLDDSEKDRRNLVFKGAFFWSIPEEDLEVAESVWMDTVTKIRSEDFEHFTRISDRRLFHVRPHGRDSSDTLPYKGKEYVKRCFWFNGDYVKDIVKRAL